VKNGVPFNAAWGLAPGADPELDDLEMLALAVVFGEFEGGSFDWDAMCWRRRD
jgi:hypothetical protein